MFTEEEIKTYEENIRANQVKVICSSCGMELYIFPEHINNSRCRCGEILTDDFEREYELEYGTPPSITANNFAKGGI